MDRSWHFYIVYESLTVSFERAEGSALRNVILEQESQRGILVIKPF